MEEYCYNVRSAQSSVRRERRPCLTSDGVRHRNGANPPKARVEPQRTPNGQGDPEEGARAGGISLPDFTPHGEATATETVRNWLKTGAQARGTGRRAQDPPRTGGVR